MYNYYKDFLRGFQEIPEVFSSEFLENLEEITLNHYFV